MNATATATAENLVSCAYCGDRFATVADSIPHLTDGGCADDTSITAAEAKIFGDLLAIEDAIAAANAAIAFAPAMLSDSNLVALHDRRTTVKAAAVTAFDNGYAAIGIRMAWYGTYRTIAAHAAAITAAIDL